MAESCCVRFNLYHCLKKGTSSGVGSQGASKHHVGRNCLRLCDNNSNIYFKTTVFGNAELCEIPVKVSSFLYLDINCGVGDVAVFRVQPEKCEKLLVSVTYRTVII